MKIQRGRGRENEARESATEKIRVVQIITSLAKGGAQATVVASAQVDDPTVDMTILAGPEVTTEGAWWGHEQLDDVAVQVVPDLVRRPAPMRDLLAFVWIVRALRRLRPDVVHTHSFKGGVVGRLAAAALGIPVVHTVHGWGALHSSNPLVRGLALRIERVLASVTDTMVLVGRSDQFMAERLGIGHDYHRRLIRSGIELPDRESIPETRRRVRTDLSLTGRFVVGMVGRLAAPKDHLTLLEAFWLANLPGATLLIIGDGPERERIERFAAELLERDPSLDVRFLGQRDDAVELVAAFDIAVHSSRFEGLPRTVVEAAASGVPVVSADVGSVSDVIEDGLSGRLVAPGDPGAMSGAMVELADDPHTRRRLADEALSRTGRFALERMRGDLVHLWWESAHREAPESLRVAKLPLPFQRPSVGSSLDRGRSTVRAAAKRGGVARRGQVTDDRRNPGGGRRSGLGVRRNSISSAPSPRRRSLPSASVSSNGSGSSESTGAGQAAEQR